jgi:hypothetical protein
METDIPIEIEFTDYGDGYSRWILRQDIEEPSKYRSGVQGVALSFQENGNLCDFNTFNKGKSCNMLYWYNKDGVFYRVESIPIPNKRAYFCIQRYKNDTHRSFYYK